MIINSMNSSNAINIEDKHTSDKDFVVKVIETPAAVNSVCISPDNEYLISATEIEGKSVIIVWSLKTYDKVQLIYEPGVYLLAFNPDGKNFASYAGLNNIKVWNVSNWQMTARFKTQIHGTDSITYSRDGTMLLAASTGIYAWNIYSKEKVYRFSEDLTTTIKFVITNWPSVSSVTTSLDGKYMGYVDVNGDIRMRKMATGNLAKTIKSDSVLFRLSPDSSILATTTRDIGEIALYDIKKAQK